MKDIETEQHSSYVEVTSRTLKQRLKERRRDIGAGKLSTTLAIDACKNNTNIYWEDAKVIRQVKKKTRLYSRGITDDDKAEQREFIK